MATMTTGREGVETGTGRRRWTLDEATAVREPRKTQIMLRLCERRRLLTPEEKRLRRIAEAAVQPRS